MDEKERKKKTQEHIDRLNKVDWSDPRSLLREVRHAQKLDEEAAKAESGSTATLRAEPPKAIQ